MSCPRIPDPKNENVTLRRLDQSTGRADSMLALPENIEGLPNYGRIDKIGPGVPAIEPELQPGRVVIYNSMMAVEVVLDDETFIAIPAQDVLAFVPEDDDE